MSNFKLKKTEKTAWVVLRGNSIPRGSATFEWVGRTLDVCCIFPTKIAAFTWMNHWNNKKEFRIEKIRLIYRVE